MATGGLSDDPTGVERRKEEVDRRHKNVALIEYRLNELTRDMTNGFMRLEGKIDSNLESLSERLERQSERASERAEALAEADRRLAEAVEKRTAMLEDEMEKRVTALERWRVEVEAGLKTVEKVQDKGIKAKHLWLAGIGVVVAIGGLLTATAAVIVTILLSQ